MLENTFKSDGCACFPGVNHGNCCVDRDRIYWMGGTPDQRQVAEVALRQCITA